MPMYDYICSACDHHFESLQRSSRDPSPACPQCGDVRVVKQLSTVSVGSASGSDRRTFAELPRSRGGGCGRCGDPQGPCTRD